MMKLEVLGMKMIRRRRMELGMRVIHRIRAHRMKMQGRVGRIQQHYKLLLVFSFLQG